MNVRLKTSEVISVLLVDVLEGVPVDQRAESVPARVDLAPCPPTSRSSCSASHRLLAPTPSILSYSIALLLRRWSGRTTVAYSSAPTRSWRWTLRLSLPRALALESSQCIEGAGEDVLHASGGARSATRSSMSTGESSVDVRSATIRAIAVTGSSRADLHPAPLQSMRAM